MATEGRLLASAVRHMIFERRRCLIGRGTRAELFMGSRGDESRQAGR
jgi:hypothetical protein